MRLPSVGVNISSAFAIGHDTNMFDTDHVRPPRPLLASTVSRPGLLNNTAIPVPAAVVPPFDVA